MTRLIVRRKNEWLNRMRSFGIYLDGVKRGTIANNETLEFEIPEGTHQLSARIDWCGSNVHDFSVETNEAHTVILGAYRFANSLTFIEALLLVAYFVVKWIYGVTFLLWLLIPFLLVNLYYITAGRKQYLRIKEDKNSFSF